MPAKFRTLLSLTFLLLSSTFSLPASAAQEIKVSSGTIRVIPLSHASAGVLVDHVRDLLGEKGELKILADGRSNALVVRGPADLVQAAVVLIGQLDTPEKFRIFRLNYLDPVEAVEILESSFFNSGKASKVGPQIRATVTTLPGNSSTGGLGGISVPPPEKKDFTVAVANQSPKFVPISRDNTLMVIGSSQDFVIVEKLLASLDKRARQVVIQTQILEINDVGEDTLGVNFNTQSGGMAGASVQGGSNRFQFDTITRRASQLQFEINALIKSNKAKMLASPSVLAMNERKSAIRIVDNIIEKIDSVTTTNANTSVTAKSITQGSAGITLEILPRINDDGYIVLSVHPEISFVREKVLGQNMELMATLKSTREFQTQEIMVRDGDTLVIGGLIQDRTSEAVEKLPWLGDIPILGRFFQRRTLETTRTEVRIFITPQILAEPEEKKHDHPAQS
ncbi:MAG TPA: hypothetical protein DD435_13805 [Cyanobacteria bacterium UBA8530]|nr:hypothetical protein [Cyanobacteria bacterium UBA8530]